MGGRTERDSVAVGVVGNVCNFPFYGAVGNVVCKDVGKLLLLFHML